MMWRRLMFLGCFGLTMLSSQAQVSVSLSNLPESVVESGTSHTIVVGVTYTGSDTIELRFDQEIPKPLRALVFTRRFEISAGKSQNILVPVSVPRRTPAGKYKLNFIIKKGSSEVASSSVVFEVPKRTEIDVSLVERPPYARANDTISARFLINNTGNDKEVLTMFSKHCIVQGPNVITIPPDSSMFIDVIMIPDITLMRIDDRAIGLSCDVQNANKVVSDQEIIRIYPIKTKKVDPYFRFPIAVNTNYIYRTSNGETTLNTYQIQVTGKGALDMKKRHHLIFDYRGPGSVRITRLGNFAQKYAQYYNKRFDVFLGEKTFGLSNLTENFRFGSGVEANWIVKDGLKVGAYYNRPMLQPEVKQQFAGYAEHQTPKKHVYRLNTLVNSMSDSTQVTMVSAQTTWSDYDKWSLSTEISRSQSDTGGGFAYSYSGNAEFGRLRLSSSGMYAGHGFQGFFNNSAFLNLNAAYNLEKVGFQLGGNFNDENPNLDTVFSAAPYSIFLNGGMIGRFRKNWHLQVLGLYRQKTDRLNNKRFDYRERRIRFSTGYRYGFWNVNFLTEAGRTTNFLIADSTNRDAFGFDAQFKWSYAPNARFSISGFGQYLNNTRFTETRFRYFLYGGNIRYRLHKKILLEGDFQNNYLVEDLYNDRNLINFSVDFQAFANHRIRGVVNYGILHNQPIRRDWFYTASYAFKVGIPLKKTLDLGTVIGTIENKGVERVDKVVLILDGQLVTTNENGQFEFNNVRPGIHQLFIDKRSIGVRDMADIKMPLEIEVLPDQKVKVNFGLTQSGSVKGKVNMQKVFVVQSSREKIVQPRIIIKINNGEEEFLTQTDADGNFLFGSLRPGKWHVSMVQAHWKEKFKVKIGEADIEVEAGAQSEVKLLIVPIVREVKFLDTKTIKIGGGKE